MGILLALLCAGDAGLIAWGVRELARRWPR